MHFRSRSVYHSKRFEYSADLSIRQGWVNQSEQADFFELLTQIENDVEFSLNFSYPHQLIVSESQTRLVESLKAMKNE
jgi:hypothetical protein